MKILMVMTSHDQLGNTGEKTGLWLEEFAAPYFVFRDAGVELTLASPKGGQPPIDPKSDKPENQTDAQRRFKMDESAQRAFANTLPLSQIRAADYEAVFYPGGHGPMWDLVDDKTSIELIEAFYDAGKPVAAVCHAPAVLHRVMHNGESIVKGKRVTGFANSEEEIMKLTEVVPFLVEDELKRLGGKFEKAADWQSYVVVDGTLITGQNPASSTAGARALLDLLSLKAVGHKLVEMCNQGRNFELMRTMYTPDIVSVEGSGEETSGTLPVIQKSERWQANNTIHQQVVRGPFFSGPNQFAAHFSFEVTPKLIGRRVTLEEVAVYTVQGDKISREQFFYDGER